MNIYPVVRRLVNLTGTRRMASVLVETYCRLKRWNYASRNNVTYHLDLSQLIDRQIFFGGWEPDTIAFLKRALRHGDLVVEVGANIGAHTLLIADLVGPRGHVYAFEPTEFASLRLLENIALNERLRSRISLRRELVTNHAGSVPTTEIVGSFPVEGQIAYKPEKVTTKAIALDTMHLTRLDLLKIDVDGYDFKVLEGASGLIERFRPAVLIELCEHSLRRQGDSIRDIFAFMLSRGYVALDERGQPIQCDAVLDHIGLADGINAVFMAEAH